MHLLLRPAAQEQTVLSCFRSNHMFLGNSVVGIVFNRLDTFHEASSPNETAGTIFASDFLTSHQEPQRTRSCTMNLERSTSTTNFVSALLNLMDMVQVDMTTQMSMHFPWNW